MSAPASATPITSRDNPLLKDLRRLAQHTTEYRRQGQFWLEGDHLCRALIQRGQRPQAALFAESFWPQAQVEFGNAAARSYVLPDALFAGLSTLESPSPMGFVVALPPQPAIAPDTPTVILDRVQDAGNVGAILRCAAAFGFRQVIALKGTAGLWSPKVLRAGMGGHFGLDLIEAMEPDAVTQLRAPVVTTSSHQGELLHRAQLPWPCAWAFGHEGQGVSEHVAALAKLAVRIVQPGGEESLNVATAAAICLHASAAAQARDQ